MSSDGDEENWMKEVTELENRKSMARRLGGEEGINRQRQKGKLTVRERIEKVVDKGSFSERGILAGEATYENDVLVNITPSTIVMGIGKINGKRIAIHGDDFTIKGASVGKIYKQKLGSITKMAHDLRLPVIRLLDGAGGTIKELMKIGYTEVPTITDEAIRLLAEIMSMMPVASLGLGPVSGLGALLMVESHFSVMVKNLCQVSVGGPPLIKAAMGQDIDKEDLGGYKVHTRISGVVDNEAESEEDAFAQIIRFLEYMPSNVWEMPQRKFGERDSPSRREEELLTIIPKNPKKTYDIRKLLTLILDNDSFFEIGEYQGRSQITALARINGYPVGILANDSKFKGGSFAWDVAEKFQRFIDMCDTFHLPIVNFIDQPGFYIGKIAEEYGTIRKGVRASFSVVQATVPWFALYIRKAFGVAGAVQANNCNENVRYAWPSAAWGNIPAEGGVYAAHKREIQQAENPEKCHQELIRMYRNVSSPFKTAEVFGIEDIIDPRDTRKILCDWIEAAYSVEKTRLGRKYRGMRC